MINHILIQDRFLQSVYHQVNKSPDNNHNYGEHTWNFPTRHFAHQKSEISDADP